MGAISVHILILKNKVIVSVTGRFRLVITSGNARVDFALDIQGLFFCVEFKRGLNIVDKPSHLQTRSSTRKPINNRHICLKKMP